MIDDLPHHENFETSYFFETLVQLKMMQTFILEMIPVFLRIIYSVVDSCTPDPAHLCSVVGITKNDGTPYEGIRK